MCQSSLQGERVSKGSQTQASPVSPWTERGEREAGHHGLCFALLPSDANIRERSDDGSPLQNASNVLLSLVYYARILGFRSLHCCSMRNVPGSSMYVCMGVCLASSILFARQAAMIYVSNESGRQLVCIHCRCCGGVWVFFPWPWHDLHTWV